MLLLPLFAVTTFLSAALLFGVQPMFAKTVLPLLGGSPAVWTTCMLFFQTLLLAGYAYAHGTSRRMAEKPQALLHVAVVAAPVALLPVSLPAGWTPPIGQTPVFWLLALLTVSVGGPFFALSATTPLLQRWFAATSHRSAGDPYFLYAASNLGSMSALLSYPFLLEPNFGLAVQSRMWSIAYAVLAAAMLICAAVVWLGRVQGPGSRVQGRKSEFSEGEHSTLNVQHSTFNASKAAGSQLSTLNPQRAAGPRPSTLDPGPSSRARLIWLALSFIPSSWMLGLTTYLTTDIAPVPLLWIIPLSLYLLTFILVFARRVVVPHAWMVRLFPATLILLAVSTVFRGSWTVMLVHVAAFFVGSMVCHGELVRRRPHVTRLTEFYLLVSLGGMLGGLFNAVTAPLVFSRVLEYPLTIALGCLVTAPLYTRDAAGTHVGAKVAAALLPAALFAFLYDGTSFRSSLLFDVSLGAVPAALVCYWQGWSRLFAAPIAVLLTAAALDPPPDATILYSERSFFGVYRVQRDEHGNHELLHGTISHGWQQRGGLRGCVPWAYYHPTGPLGDVFTWFHQARDGRSVALVGLGAGAAITYQQPGQKFVFYEIDPVVERIAEDPDYFTYLSGCRSGEYETVLGDGRLRLSEAADRTFGMIVLDAFSGDSIPTHLLTRQAMQTYLAKLTDDGLVVLHVSNRYLNLEPVVAALAADARCICLTGRDEAVSQAMFDAGKMPSVWMIVARRQADVSGLAGLPRWTDSTRRASGRVWTDDYSNLAGTVEFRWR